MSPRKKKNRTWTTDRGLSLAWLFFGVPLAYFFAVALVYREGALQSLHNVWGDWSFHLTLVSSFAHRPFALWLDHPAFAGHPLHYPFWINLLSGLLLKIYDSFWFAISLPSMVLAFVYVTALYRFGHLHTKRAGTALLFILLVVANGGLGFIYWVQDLLNHPELFREGFPTLSYTRDDGRGLYFMNYLTGSFIPQRAWLLGAPWMLWILGRLWKAEGDEPRAWAKLGALSGVLIVLHPHTFVCLGFFCLFYFLTEPRRWRRAGWFALGTVAVALPLYGLFLKGTGGKAFWFWCPGWYAAETNRNVIEFWWWNAGIFLPLAILSTIRLKLWRHPFVQAGWAIFIFANLARMQPWLWDNTKLFAWSQVGLAIPVAIYLGNVWDSSKGWGRATAVALTLVLSLSGLIDLSRLLFLKNAYVPMWSASDVELAAEFRRRTDPAARVLTTPVPHNWVSALSGRQVLLGYPAWIWSHGEDCRPREQEIATMLTGEPGALGLLERLGVDYVVIGPSERAKGVKEDFFRQRYSLFLENRYTRVYRVR